MIEYDEIDRLKELLDDTGLSVTKFATKANVNQSNLSAILNRKRKLGSNVLIKIAETFEVNPRWLLSGDGTKHKTCQSTLSDIPPDYQSSNNIDYKEKYINELEEQVKLLKELNHNLQKELNLKSEIIQGFLEGSISKL